MTGALELLQQLLRTPPPELLRALTTPGGLAQLRAPRQEPGSRSRSGSIVELIGECSPTVESGPGQRCLSSSPDFQGGRCPLHRELTCGKGRGKMGSLCLRGCLQVASRLS